MKPQKIVNVKYVGIQPTKNITVDSESHLFFANGGIVTSNSHAVSYAMLAYYTLFLKTHFPAQFMCSLFNYTDLAKEDRSGNTLLSRYVRYSRTRGIKILPPDINSSAVAFSLEGTSSIRWGLGSIKNVAGAAADELVSKRPFESLNDSFVKVEKRKVNKTKVVSLIKAGAFDSLGADREYTLNKYLLEIRKEKESMTFTDAQRVDAEIELLGVCLSVNVIPDIDDSWLAENNVDRLSQIDELFKGNFLCRIKSVVERPSKKGKNMLVVNVFDDDTERMFYVWQNSIDEVRDLLKPKSLVIVPLKKFDDGGACFYSGPLSALIKLEE